MRARLADGLGTRLIHCSSIQQTVKPLECMMVWLSIVYVAISMLIDVSWQDGFHFSLFGLSNLAQKIQASATYQGSLEGLGMHARSCLRSAATSSYYCMHAAAEVQLLL